MDVGAQAGREYIDFRDFTRLTPAEFGPENSNRISYVQPPTSFTMCVAGGREVLRITTEGDVIAPSLGDASEAGRVFVESVKYGIEELVNELVERRARALLADETWRALA